MSGGRWEALDIPVGVRVLSVGLGAEARGGVLSESGGGDRIGAAAGDMGRDGGGESATGRRWSRISRRCWSAGGATAMEAWIVPVDACYELAGRIRKNWKGFDGGGEAWREIDEFLTGLREREGSCA